MNQISGKASSTMAAKEKHRLLVRNASQIVTVCSNKEERLVGSAMNTISVLDSDKEGLSVAVGVDGTIISMGTDSQVEAELPEACFERVIEARGNCVIPGLIDAHTHPVWVGDRVHEFAMKVRTCMHMGMYVTCSSHACHMQLAGATYMDVHAQGGGIHYTVNCVQKATPSELYDSLKPRLHQMLACGTTTLEAKSGYGLTLEAELKMLQVLEQAKRDTPLTISSTYCGAHAVPRFVAASLFCCS